MCEDTSSEDFFPLVIRAGQIGDTQIGWLLFAAMGLIRLVPLHLHGHAEHDSCGDVSTRLLFVTNKIIKIKFYIFNNKYYNCIRKSFKNNNLISRCWINRVSRCILRLGPVRTNGSVLLLVMILV